MFIQWFCWAEWEGRKYREVNKLPKAIRELTVRKPLDKREKEEEIGNWNSSIESSVSEVALILEVDFPSEEQQHHQHHLNECL